MVANVTLLCAAAMALVCGCNSGEVAPCCDIGVVVDRSPGPLDATLDAPIDAPAGEARPDGTPPDGTPPGEGTPPVADGGGEGGPPDPCSSWSNWSCSETDPTFICKATCNGGALPQALNCVASGDCICGIGLGSCGKFGGPASGCDACRKAVEADCCKLKGP